MLDLHLLSIARSRTAIIALVATFCFGLAGIYTGKAFLRKQNRAIEAAARYQQQHIERLIKFENKEFGLLMYYLKFSYANKPLPITAMSIGQRDVNSNTQSVTIRSLEAQKYDTDLENPFNLMMGNIDLSFVILLIFPLLIITLSFNLLSEEKENGTWRLVFAQTSSPMTYLVHKWLAVIICTTANLVILLLAAIWILETPLNKPLLQYSGISFLYLLFWFALSFLVTSYNQKSSFNAIVLLGFWLLLTLVLPAALNTAISNRYPVPEALRTMLRQRDGYHRKWDQPKDSTLQTFFAAYPQYRHQKWEAQGFDWLWYYAMQHGGDAEAKNDRIAFMKKLAARNQASYTLSLLIPSVNAQLLHNEISQSNLSAYLAFLDSTTAFHENLRLYFYPKIFAAAPVLREDWKKHQIIYHNPSPVALPAANIISLIAFCLLPLVCGIVTLKRMNHQ